MKLLKYIVALLVILVTTYPANAVLKIADALQSNMLVQQNKAFKVWGTANASEKVSIQADWMFNPITVIADQEGHF